MQVLVEYIYANCYNVTVAMLIGASVLWFFKRRGSTMEPIVDLDNQTRQLKDGSRVAGFLEGDELKSRVFDDIETAYDTIFRGLRVSNNGPMLGFRKKLSKGYGPYTWLSYKDVLTQSENLAYGLHSVSGESGQKTFIGIYSKNRPEWVISEFAIYKLNSVVVPLYDTLGPQSLHYIVQLCNLKTVICDSNAKAQTLIRDIKEHPALKRLIVIDELEDDTVEIAKQANIDVYALEDVICTGNKLIPKPTFERPKPEDISTVCFTSGTTGIPKGVILTHKNLLASSVMLLHVKYFSPTPDQTLLSFLPLAHMYERICENGAISLGGKIGYYSGDVRNLVDDMQALKPTVVPLVPRVLDRLCDGIMKEARKSCIKLTLLKIAVLWKKFLIKRKCYCNDTLVDKLVFEKIRQKLGGNLRLMFVGAAPVSDEVLQFSRIVLGCTIVSGFGQTECVAACTGTVEADFTTGHVGIPLLNAALKLMDVPELGYFAKNNVGEVCVRGPSIFKGYYKNEKATKEALDDEGWLHTGDIGRWNKNGTLSIIDRKKFIFKLQQGEYIAPEKLEEIFIRSLYVAQVFIYGESLKTSLIGIVVPEEQMLYQLAAEIFNIKNASLNELCSNKDIKSYIMNDMNEVGRKNGLFSFECVKDIHLTTEQFTAENGLLTPTLKNRRNDLKKHFSSEIIKMYSALK